MKYSATKASPEVRNALGSVGKVLHDDGMKVDQVRRVYSKAGFSFSRATLFKYIRAVDAGWTPMSQQKASGRKRALDDEQQAVMTGLFLTREDNKKVSSLSTYAAFALDMFDVHLSKASVSRYMRKAELSIKLLGPRKRGTKRSRDELALDALECIQRLNNDGYLSYPKANLWSIDAVTDTQQHDRVKSIGRLGGNQQKFPLTDLVYTSSIVTLVSAKGEQLGPGIFTSNPDLNPNGRNRNAIARVLRKLHLRWEDLYYIPGGKNYMKESRAMYQSFLNDHLPWGGHVVITDANSHFTKNGENIFENIGFDAAPQLNSDSHGMLSINDGILHKVAKAEWRSRWYENQPQWDKTLDLAYCLITVNKDMVARKWREHF